tara:strand:+ start:4584 stop:5510 length:927 start_codon:yes stop_codon:yes gene_type:complete
MKILITDKISTELLSLLKKNNIQYKININDSKSKILEIINEFDGLIVRNRLTIDANFLHKAKKIKFIGRYGSGMELIDLTTAKQLNINCFNSGEGNANAVAEHNLGMLLSLLKNIHSSSKQVSKFIWDRENNRGVEIEGSTIGVIGYGNTGKAFCDKLMNFNCKIIVYDKYKSGFGNNIIREDELESIYRNCNIISFHIPLNKENKYIFSKQFIDKMNKPFYLLNTSRGAIVNTSDLIEGLKMNKILGAGLDVIENENINFKNIKINQNLNYLVNCEKVILTPHIAGLSINANKKISKTLIKKILKQK